MKEMFVIDNTQYYCRFHDNTLKRTGSSFSSKRFLSEDPTLPRKEIYCPNCGSMTDHVLFIAHKIAGEENMQQIKECRNAFI